MNNTRELANSLNVHLNWHKQRIDCFAKMLLALIAVRTVNLREVAVALHGKAKIDSKYKRLQRFFAQFTLDQNLIAQWIFKIFFNNDKKFYLAIDRTNWYWGKRKINILMLAITYKGLAIPIFWTMLSKAGNSNDQDR